MGELRNANLSRPSGSEGAQGNGQAERAWRAPAWARAGHTGAKRPSGPSWGGTANARRRPLREHATMASECELRLRGRPSGGNRWRARGKAETGQESLDDLLLGDPIENLPRARTPPWQLVAVLAGRPSSNRHQIRSLESRFGRGPDQSSQGLTGSQLDLGACAFATLHEFVAESLRRSVPIHHRS